MADELFPGASVAVWAKGGTTVPSRCNNRGTLKDWNTQGATRPIYPPRCNRASGHDGPHRTYKRNAGIRAEWPS